MNIILDNDDNHDKSIKQEKNVPVPMNLSSPQIYSHIENRKICEIRSFKKEWRDAKGQGGSAQVEILHNPKLGTLNTADQRVLLCLLELWEEQGKSDKVVFSIRHIIRMLGNHECGKSYNQVRDSLLRLGTVNFHWNGGFYNFAEKEYIDIEKAFSILSSVAIATKRKRNVTSEECYAVINEEAVKNLLNNGSIPIRRLIIQSFKSSITQLLYTHLNRQLFGTNGYTRTTKGLIEDLGITTKRYNRLSNRKELFYICREEILGKETSYFEIINYFELYDSNRKDKDWIVDVRRTGESKIFQQKKLSSSQRILEVFPEAKNNAPDESLTIQPMEIVGQEKKLLKTQNNSISEQVATKPQKTESRAVGKEKSSAYEFLTLFAQLFPKAKAPEKTTKPVKDNVNKFIDTHGLERAKDFLVYCAELGKQDNFRNLMEGSTFNWLYKYKLGNQLLIDSWLQESAKDSKCINEQRELEKTKNYNIWCNFEKKYITEYQAYLFKQIKSLSQEQTEKFEKFKKTYPIKITSNFTEADCFFIFCEIEGLYELCFVEWASKFKRDEYLAIRHYRDTGKEGRRIASLGWD
jgi:hypothetical protein